MFAMQHWPSDTCGVSYLYNFSKVNNIYKERDNISNLVLQGGIGIFFAGFIVGHEESDKMYNELKSKYPILYQSEPRLNVNSGNMFYIVLFDAINISPYGFDAYRKRENS